MNLKSDAKLRRALGISKEMHEIFSELLRRDRIEATKGGQRPKSCREQIIIPNFYRSIIKIQAIIFCILLAYLYLCSVNSITLLKSKCV